MTMKLNLSYDGAIKGVRRNSTLLPSCIHEIIFTQGKDSRFQKAQVKCRSMQATCSSLDLVIVITEVDLDILTSYISLFCLFLTWTFKFVK